MWPLRHETQQGLIVIRKLVIPKELGDVEVRMLDWLKAEGDAVAAGDALLEFETDKAIVVVTASESGVLRRTFAASGDWMKPGDTVAWLSASAEDPLPAGDDVEGETLPVTFDVT
jgi:pyruvate/2-oxoglutarate dehydrogenase complex dihydrolipoamide acyltransferase (E2) component